MKSKSYIELFQALLSGNATKISMYRNGCYQGSIGLIDTTKDLSQYEINLEVEELTHLFHLHLWFGVIGCHYHFDEYEIEFKGGAYNGK